MGVLAPSSCPHKRTRTTPATHAGMHTTHIQLESLQNSVLEEVKAVFQHWIPLGSHEVNARSSRGNEGTPAYYSGEVDVVDVVGVLSLSWRTDAPVMDK